MCAAIRADIQIFSILDGIQLRTAHLAEVTGFFFWFDMFDSLRAFSCLVKQINQHTIPSPSALRIIGYVKYAVFHRIGVEICPFKRIGQQHGQLSVCVRDNALEQHFGQRTFHAGRCLPAVSAKRHELANHAVIKRWDMISLINGSVYADANSASQMHGLNGARDADEIPHLPH